MVAAFIREPFFFEQGLRPELRCQLRPVQMHRRRTFAGTLARSRTSE